MAGGEKAAKSQIDSILCHPWKDGNNTGFDYEIPVA